MDYCDLHIHSTHSDSALTVKEIIEKANIRGLRAIALTDHDTVSGLDEAKDLGSSRGIEVISGIEISAQHFDSEIHILGYFIDHNAPEIKSAVATIGKYRLERILKMLEKLNELGVALSQELLLARIKDSIPTRLHLGLALIEAGYGTNLSKVFKKYLSPGRPAYISRFKYSVKDACDLIKSAGGLPFLAHPHIIRDQSWVEEFIAFGIAGLEIEYFKMPAVKRMVYNNMLKKYDLLRSGGSDAHGKYKPFIDIGDIPVSYDCVLDMKKRLKL
ncbi:MAG: PHP domain-containing protein [Candidatus Omnitrophica bacterium]|nr:PHP domain-containing protein [Candidatus Omnitrophota bacterium]